MEDIPAESASMPANPDRAATWHFRGRLNLPSTLFDDNTTNEISYTFISDAFDSFSDYQAARLDKLKTFSFSFDTDRSHVQRGAALTFTGFVTAKTHTTIRHSTVMDWMPGLVLEWTAVPGRRDQHPLIAAFLVESALRNDRLTSSCSSGGVLKLRVDRIDPSCVAVSKGSRATPPDTSWPPESWT